MHILFMLRQLVVCQICCFTLKYSLMLILHRRWFYSNWATERKWKHTFLFFLLSSCILCLYILFVICLPMTPDAGHKLRRVGLIMRFFSLYMLWVFIFLGHFVYDVRQNNTEVRFIWCKRLNPVLCSRPPNPSHLHTTLELPHIFKTYRYTGWSVWSADIGLNKHWGVKVVVCNYYFFLYFVKLSLYSDRRIRHRSAVSGSTQWL